MKKLFLSAAIMLSASVAFAQQKAFEPTKLKDHWFIQLQGGISYTVSEYHRDASFGDLISPHVALSAGKHFSPVVGARLQVGGWQSKNFYKYTTSPSSSTLKEGTYKTSYVQVNADGMLNLINLFTPYDADRAFNLYGIAGIGYAHGFKKENISGLGNISRTNSILPRIGIQGDYQVSDAVNLNLELVGNLYPDNFNGVTQGKKYDGTINLLLGMTYKFTQGGFKMVEATNPAVLAELNRNINDQRAQLNDKNSEISRLKQELAKKKEPEVIVKEIKEAEILMNAVVVFRIGSAQLEKNQDINIYNAARYLKENPQVRITITGYADKSTGTAAVNQRLSEQRVEAVANVLIDKYGIAPSRISQKASGDKEQLFPTDEWNRVVVFTAISE